MAKKLGHRTACLIAVAAIATVFTACGPEDGRVRGQPGADIGNKAPDFKPRSKVFAVGGGEGDPK